MMEPTGAAQETKTLGSVVPIDEGRIRAHLDEVTQATAEAKRDEQADGRQDT